MPNGPSVRIKVRRFSAGLGSPGHKEASMKREPTSVRRAMCAVTIALAAFALAAPPPAAAQAVYGSIAGTVTDPTGAALPGVTVTITSVERKTVDTVTTNESGFYAKERLLPGRYEVKAE